MDTRTKKQALVRLARIEGQVRGIARMVEDDRYCIDVITQLRAVRAALDRAGQEILREHLRHCVSDALGNGSQGKRQRMVDELIDVLDVRRQ